MKLLEGQAYAPEIKRNSDFSGKISETFPELGAIRDDGSIDGKNTFGGSLAGKRIGSSVYAQNWRKFLGKFFSPTRTSFMHGGGTRYIEKTPFL